MPTDPSAAERAPAATYEFGPYRFEAASRSLFRAGEFVPLTPKVAETLLLLVEGAGRIVTKEELLEGVWPGVVVEEGGIANNISALRKVLDGDFDGDGAIATVARRGYRFAVDVRRADAGSPSSPAPAAAPAAAKTAPITERDTVLIADIENKTGDAVFDGTIRQALVLHLAQSPFLEIITDHKVHTVLKYMGKAGAPVVGDVALEVCQRTGSRAAITGSIFSLGDDYVIGLLAIDGNDGSILVTEQSRAHGKGEVLKAFDQAVVGLRAKLGESLASVKRFSAPFDDVATSSLEALKAYTLGRHQWLEHGEAAGKPHQLRAIELDPNFASAYSALSYACHNMGQTQEAVRYMTKAYELRERATERERMRLTASYFDVVVGDLNKALDAYRAWQGTYPRDATSVTNSGNLLMLLGRWEESFAVSQRGWTLEPLVVAASNVAIAQLALGRYEEARATLQDAAARGYTAFYLHLDAYQEAFLRGDPRDMHAHANAVAGREGEEDYLLAAQADTEAYHGRFERARDLTRRAVTSARRAGSLEMAALWEAEAALREVEIGNAARARIGAAAAQDITTGMYVHCWVGLVLARCGDSKGATELIERLDEAYPQQTVVQRYWIPSIRAAMAIANKDWKGAEHALEPAATIELGLCQPFEAGFMIPIWLRGLALMGAGRNDEAAREFLKIVARPGLIKNFVLFPLAQRMAAKALAAAGREDEAKPLREKFEAAWLNADVTLP
ncbi:hypothetical protein DSM104440_02707 [Usitatibacter palustris]|uniref:OmpR/PhoB-type domain-containing protein n=2 Tax=Usitatibacter palustris TaxID=2732487 RepID=A0A6M4H8H9_9PROT|nr:hypothetical protein DSM104440_02707 [Usitatibacter palustris]